MLPIEDSIKTIHLVFISGTGGARRVADAFRQEIIRRGKTLTVTNLDRSSLNKDQPVNENGYQPDLAILVFPLHAFDAPDPVYQWLEETTLSPTRVAVLSVSGGGEGFPNTGCRVEVCKLLEQKGFQVVYDRMMVMPCNWVMKVPDHAAMWMIKVIPQKVESILDDLFAGRVRRTQQKRSALSSYISRLEKAHAVDFPKEITITDDCTGCGLCARNCPVNNIEMVDRRPVFHDRCFMCFRCIYSCPSQGMVTADFQVLKAGFNLDALEKRYRDVELEPVDKCCRGWLYKSVREYLLNPDA